MWLLPLGFTVSQTQPVCEPVCLYANNTWIEIIQDFIHHTNHEFDCLMLGPLSEEPMGAGCITALVCSCGTQTPFNLTVLPSVMSTQPVCMSTSQDSWVALATSVTTLQTLRLFNYVRKYIIYIHFKKEHLTKMCCMDLFHADLSWQVCVLD